MSAWTPLAACLDARYAEWAFGTAEEQHAFVAMYCRGCDVRKECLADGRHDLGVRGGKTRQERKADSRDGCGCWACGHQREPRGPATDTGACGTNTGYNRHTEARQETCEPCRAAQVAYRAAMKRSA